MRVGMQMRGRSINAHFSPARFFRRKRRASLTRAFPWNPKRAARMAASGRMILQQHRPRDFVPFRPAEKLRDNRHGKKASGSGASARDEVSVDCDGLLGPFPARNFFFHSGVEGKLSAGKKAQRGKHDGWGSAYRADKFSRCRHPRN